MRKVGVLVVLAGALALAPPASAGKYRFLGSDGTDCVVSTAPSKAPEADGQLTVHVRVSISCDRGLYSYNFGVVVEGKAGYPMWDPRAFGWCNIHREPNVPCDSWPHEVQGSVADLPSDDYKQVTRVHFLLPPNVLPAWAVVPMHQARMEVPRDPFSVRGGCYPGDYEVRCYFAEDVP
ncbi:MAG TPA: hypothetical protein VF715_05125 [Thermoleophilaceae bacterium]|jgi:hypothetical protein